MATSKEKVLFYVGRHLRAAEDRAKVDQEAMAKAGVSYADRQKVTEAAASSGAEDEREALQIAYDFLRDNFYNSYLADKEGDRADQRR